MKQFRPLLVFAFGLVSLCVGLYSCEEVGPPINLTGDSKVDTTYIASQVEEPQLKVVLLEEFTGVDCRNCPDAHRVIESIQEDYPGRLIAVSLHSDDFFSIPFGNDQDLRSEEATILYGILEANGKPKGTVDRIKYATEEVLIINKYQSWRNYAEQRLAVTTPVNIYINTDFNKDTRSLLVEIILHYTSEVNIENRLSVMVLEDGVLTLQNDLGDIISNYVQNQVLRTMLTDPKGMVINETKDKGRVIVKIFTRENIPDIWEAENLKVVAFVHQFVESKEILHAQEVEVSL